MLTLNWVDPFSVTVMTRPSAVLSVDRVEV